MRLGESRSRRATWRPKSDIKQYIRCSVKVPSSIKKTGAGCPHDQEQYDLSHALQGTSNFDDDLRFLSVDDGSLQSMSPRASSRE